MRRRLVVLPAVLTALLLLPGTVWAGTLDQQQTNVFNDSFCLQDPFSPAQVFTAGLTGQLDQIDLQLVKGVDTEPPGGGGPGGDLTVEIWTVTAGEPDSPIASATATVLEADVAANTPTWVQVPITAPSVAGTQYAIVLSAPTSPCPDGWTWLSDSSNPYAGGPSYYTQDGGANWIAQARDFEFRTYVAAPVQPTPTPAASLADAATAPPATGSPLALVGFGLLLIGALAALLVANARGVVRRR